MEVNFEGRVKKKKEEILLLTNCWNILLLMLLFRIVHECVCVFSKSLSMVLALSSLTVRDVLLIINVAILFTECELTNGVSIIRYCLPLLA